MMKMDDVIKKEIDEEMKKIEVPTSLYGFAKNIKAESDGKDVPKSNEANKLRKKWFQFTAAAVLGIGVLTGSAFLNPSMAEMASKIPYLGQVFKTKPVHELLWDTLEKEGYKDFALGMRPGAVTEIEIQIAGSEKDADRERKKITNITEEVLKGKGYDSYKIKVGSYIPQVTPLTEEEIKMTELAEKLEAGLKNKGFELIYVNPYNSYIEVAIPLTEKRKEEIKAATLELAKANGSEQKVSLTLVDVNKNEREGIWTNYLSFIYEGLALKKEYKVSGYGYSYKKNHMKMIIKTTIAPTDSDAKETVAKIRKEIQAFVDSERINTSVKDDKYEIIIRDKSGNDFRY
jgi:hypothetical protein